MLVLWPQNYVHTVYSNHYSSSLISYWHFDNIIDANSTGLFAFYGIIHVLFIKILYIYSLY